MRPNCRRYEKAVSPAQAGVQFRTRGRSNVGKLGPGLRRDDRKRASALTRFALTLLLLFAATNTFAQVASNIAPPQFRNAVEERRFHALAAELRCVKCQNQSLADSNAQVAHDLRAEVLELMREGRTDAEIETYLVQRYGEFVLYRPRVDASTWLLWFGPLALLAVGAVVIVRLARRRRDAPLAHDETQEW